MADQIVPTMVPQQSRGVTVGRIRRQGIDDEFALLGVRGYYLRTMGKPKINDRGMYDDAIILVTPTAYATFNANCDPSIFEPGIANLVEGVYHYRIGTHGLSKPKPKRYKALVQAEKVQVQRDERPNPTWGWYGINIHKGELKRTSSRGCQTIYPKQWDGFIALVENEMKRHARATIPYVLV